MQNVRNITDSIFWVGASDYRLALFENLFPLTNGVAYNAYVLLDEKTALVDTVDRSVFRPFMENLLAVLNGRPLDYLIVNHMEPDHCAGIAELIHRYPQMTVVGNAKTFALIQQFYQENNFPTLQVKEGDTLSLGKHVLQFAFTPMVHWPEVMMTYDHADKVLFSADAFGSFGALGGNLFMDDWDFANDWLPEARRYYGNIVGKFGPQVQAALKKLSTVDVETICPLHGPVWRSDLSTLLGKYDLWSRYQPEEQAVAIFYASMYGNTESAVQILADSLSAAGIKHIAMYDVSNTHVSTLVAEIFRCSHIVLASPTYNNGLYPPMLSLLHDMKALNLQNRTIGLIENGSWAPVAAKHMQALLGEMKDMRILEPVVTIKSAATDATLEQIAALKAQILESLCK